MAGLLTGSLPDLTTPQERNGGVFAFASIYGVIDGSQTTAAHGSGEMPAWGMRYTVQAPHMLGDYYNLSDQEAFVRGRILALVEHLSTLQAE